jgi:hypothetical protein
MVDLMLLLNCMGQLNSLGFNPESIPRLQPGSECMHNVYPAEFDGIIFWKQAEELSILHSL